MLIAAWEIAVWNAAFWAADVLDVETVPLSVHGVHYTHGNLCLVVLTAEARRCVQFGKPHLMQWPQELQILISCCCHRFRLRRNTGLVSRLEG
jgi:hypothetical protein